VIDLEAARKQSSWARATKGTQSWCNRGLLIAAEFFVTAGAWEPAPSQVDIAGGLDDAALLVAVPALHRRGCMTRRVSLIWTNRSMAVQSEATSSSGSPTSTNGGKRQAE
jgi:hypothetical protein